MAADTPVGSGLPALTSDTSEISRSLGYIALAGPTASGKTAAALAIAREHAVEIISVDSALVYRGMDIGTAKPSAAELAAVPHHLINIRDPLQPYSAAEFVADAKRLITDIRSRARLPLLVGGTMLYFKALRDGLDAMPRADAAIRAALEQEAREQGWSALHAALARVDPVTAGRLHPGDSQRISRALEVFRLTGQPLSAFHGRSKTVAASGCQEPAHRSLGNPAGQDGLLIALEPTDRAWLHRRIAERLDAMLASGLIDEVNALRARADLHADLPAMRCVGYRQIWEYLDAQETHSLDAHPSQALKAQRASSGGGTPGLDELRDKCIFATRQLAKRQLTWLRSMPARQVVACDAPDALQQVLSRVRSFVAGRA